MFHGGYNLGGGAEGSGVETCGQLGESGHLRGRYHHLTRYAGDIALCTDFQGAGWAYASVRWSSGGQEVRLGRGVNCRWGVVLGAKG